jgi:hypothetical protein
VIRHFQGSLDVGGGSLPPTLGFVVACPKLTELTIVYPCLGDGEAETGHHLGLSESVRFATLELVNACKALPDFDTFQIVHFPLPSLDSSWGPVRTYDPSEPFHELWRDLGSGEDLVINCLKEPETGCWEGEGKKKTTVRVITLVYGYYSKFHPEVEEYEV